MRFQLPTRWLTLLNCLGQHAESLAVSFLAFSFTSDPKQPGSERQHQQIRGANLTAIPNYLCGNSTIYTSLSGF
jgi:hypothetical protein